MEHGLLSGLEWSCWGGTGMQGSKRTVGVPYEVVPHYFTALAVYWRRPAG